MQGFFFAWWRLQLPEAGQARDLTCVLIEGAIAVPVHQRDVVAVKQGPSDKELPVLLAEQRVAKVTAGCTLPKIGDGGRKALDAVVLLVRITKGDVFYEDETQKAWRSLVVTSDHAS